MVILFSYLQMIVKQKYHIWIKILVLIGVVHQMTIIQHLLFHSEKNI